MVNMEAVAKVNLISRDTKMVVLAGTVGTIKKANSKRMIIDFGHPFLYKLPWGSKLVDIRGQKETSNGRTNLPR